MRPLLFLCLAACGRIDFDPRLPLDARPDGPAIDPSLIAHYTFDDDPGDGFFDSTGHGHTATCASCPVVGSAAGRIAASFDGVDEVLAVADDSALRRPRCGTTPARS